MSGVQSEYQEMHLGSKGRVEVMVNDDAGRKRWDKRIGDKKG